VLGVFGFLGIRAKVPDKYIMSFINSLGHSSIGSVFLEVDNIFNSGQNMLHKLSRNKL